MKGVFAMTEQTVLTQIYEIQSPKAAEPLIEMGVDHIGSVVLDEQRWKISELKDTVRVVADGGAKSSLLPLFSSADSISRALDYYQPAIIHFCETVSTLPEGRPALDGLLAVQAKIRQRFPEIQIMRSLPVAPSPAENDSLMEIVPGFEPLSDFFLTDTILPAPLGNGPEHQPEPGFVGITGTPCDWDAVSRLVESTAVPVIMAGGISPDNVYDAIARTRPAGVDSCTRTNRDDGQGGTIRFEKDIEKVKRLIDEVRRAEADGLYR